MFYFTNDNPDLLYGDILDTIMKRGEMTHPRNFNCLELSPCCVSLKNPHWNIIGNPVRKLNKGFMAAELLWMLAGRDDVGFLSFYNSKIAQFSDDGLKFFGAYGPKIVAQLPYIEWVLKKDPWTRQAVINIWRESPPVTKDVPCTLMFQFIRRPLNRLNMSVYMRSQDIWLGFPYDLHNFTSIQILVACMLGLEPGEFTLNQGSLHAYQDNFIEMANAIKAMNVYKEGGTWPVELTRLSKCSGVAQLNTDWKIIIEQVNMLIQSPDIDKKIIEDIITETADPCLQQKLTWMLGHGIKKQALQLQPKGS